MVNAILGISSLVNGSEEAISFLHTGGGKGLSSELGEGKKSWSVMSQDTLHMVPHLTSSKF